MVHVAIAMSAAALGLSELSQIASDTAETGVTEVSICQEGITEKDEVFDLPDPILMCGGTPGRLIATYEQGDETCVAVTTGYGYRISCASNRSAAAPPPPSAAPSATAQPRLAPDKLRQLIGQPTVKLPVPKAKAEPTDKDPK